MRCMCRSIPVSLCHCTRTVCTLQIRCQSSDQLFGEEKLTAYGKTFGPVRIAFYSYFEANAILIWCHLGSSSHVLLCILATAYSLIMNC